MVVDEPFLRGSSTNRDFPGKSNDSNGISKASDDVEFKSEFTEVSLSCLLTDVQILQVYRNWRVCVALCTRSENRENSGSRTLLVKE